MSDSAEDPGSALGAPGVRPNPVIAPADENPEQNDRAVTLDLYKLAVEMADRMSARRSVANTFFLTVNTGLAALLGGQTLRWYVAVAGIVFAVTWWWLLQNYRRLSSAKFMVINSIERTLPVELFSEEWRHLQSTGIRRTAAQTSR